MRVPSRVGFVSNGLSLVVALGTCWGADILKPATAAGSTSASNALRGIRRHSAANPLRQVARHEDVQGFKVGVGATST